MAFPRLNLTESLRKSHGKYTFRRGKSTLIANLLYLDYKVIINNTRGNSAENSRNFHGISRFDFFFREMPPSLIITIDALSFAQHFKQVINPVLLHLVIQDFR